MNTIILFLLLLLLLAILALLFYYSGYSKRYIPPSVYIYEEEEEDNSPPLNFIDRYPSVPNLQDIYSDINQRVPYFKAKDDIINTNPVYARETTTKNLDDVVTGI